MRIVANKTVGAGNPSQDSRKRLLEAKRKIYERIRAQLAKERPVEAACPRTQQQSKTYAYSYHSRNYNED